MRYRLGTVSDDELVTPSDPRTNAGIPFVNPCRSCGLKFYTSLYEVARNVVDFCCEHSLRHARQQPSDNEQPVPAWGFFA
jgi:hypothetical protein